MIKITWELYDYFEKVLKERFKEYGINNSTILDLNLHVDRDYLISYVLCEIADPITETYEKGEYKLLREVPEDEQSNND